jgi:phospholipase C
VSARRIAVTLAVVVPAALVIWAFAEASGATASSVSHAPRTPIKHFIVLMQENHTFDNYFGTYPGADGIPANTTMPVDPQKGPTPYLRPFHITGSTEDLDHSIVSAEIAFDHGRMDGFARAQHVRSPTTALTMGYYDGRDVPFYWNVADRYVLFDHFFTSALGGSYINHVYWVAAAPGTAHQRGSRAELHVTTIFDRLQRAGVSWKFYVQNYDPSLNYRTLSQSENPNYVSQVVWCPLLDIARFLDDPQLRSHIVDLSQYYRDLRAGTLPQVAYIAPSGGSEHPPGSLMTGQRTVRGMVNALMASSAWDSSAFMVAYDDWGGWYDHVRPPRRDAHGTGFRAPALLVSPYARQHYIDHTSLDFTSMLKFIEQNWNIAPLTRLDATAGSLLGAFDFGQAPRPPAIIPLSRAAPQPTSSVKNAALSSLYGVSALVAAVLILGFSIGPLRRVFARSGGRS